MDKVLLTDLKKKLFIRSSLIALNSLDELLGLNDYLSADEVLLEIIKNALREFEITCPLILEMKMNTEQMGTCYGMPGYAEVKSNFTLYLDCIISEDQIVLVPNSLPKWRLASGWTGVSSYPVFGAYTSFSDYVRPYLFIADMPSMTQFYMKGICSRPIIPDFKKDKTFNSRSRRSAIYYLNVEEGARGKYFMDLCMCHLLDYIRQQKASVTLPSMSVDVLANVDSSYQELRARCDNYALQSGWYGELLD